VVEYTRGHRHIRIALESGCFEEKNATKAKQQLFHVFMNKRKGKRNQRKNIPIPHGILGRKHDEIFNHFQQQKTGFY
jgi:hypothetical protein